MNIQIFIALSVLGIMLLFTFDVIKFPIISDNKPTTTTFVPTTTSLAVTTTSVPTTTPITPISLQVPFLNKPGYNFTQRINLQNQLIFDNSDKYFAEIFKAPASGIISGIVLKAKAIPIIQNPSFLISTRADSPEYQTTIIQNTTDNIILYCDILEFKQKYSIPDSVVSVNKDTPIFLLKNNIIYSGTLTNVQIDIYYI